MGGFGISRMSEASNIGLVSQYLSCSRFEQFCIDNKITSNMHTVFARLFQLLPLLATHSSYPPFILLWWQNQYMC
jgi:hypothetical protein